MIMCVILSVLNAELRIRKSDLFNLDPTKKKAKNKWKSRYHMFIHGDVPFNVHIYIRGLEQNFVAFTWI
jgi:hypothetical protein